MEVLSQKKYLLQVKNAMLFHFRQKEVRFTLEDVKQLFESGKGDGKTDEEINKELGMPKEFVKELRYDGHRDFLKPKMATYIFAGLVLCILAGYALETFNLVFYIILAVLFPIYIWSFCGGSCLYELSDGGAHQKLKYGLFTLVSMGVIIMQQVFAAYINHNVTPEYDVTLVLIQNVRAFEIGTKFFVFVSLLVLAVLAFEVFCGNYLSFATLTTAVGTICSSVYFLGYLWRFDAPSSTYKSLCVLPYAAGIVFSAVFLVYSWRKSERRA